MISPQVVQVTENKLGNVHPVIYIGGVIAITLKAADKVCKRVHIVNFYLI